MGIDLLVFCAMTGLMTVAMVAASFEMPAT